jgi:hypothetical protein
MSKLSRSTNLRNFSISTSAGKNVRDTQQLKGEAKNSLHGKNSLKEYRTSGHGGSGPFGGENKSQ